MADWRDRLQRGRIGQVPFLHESVEDSGGHRLVQHLFPGRDTPEYDEQGLDPDAVNISGYLLGDDFLEQKQALLDELKKKGPKQVVHPYAGQKQWRVKNWRFRHTTREGRVVRFTLQLVPAGETLYPSASLDTQAGSNAAADAVAAAAAADFVDDFSVAGAPSFVAEDAAGMIDGLRSDLAAINGRISAITQPITEFAESVNRLGQEAAQLVRQPAELVAQVQGVLYTAAGLQTDLETAFSFYDNLLGSDDPSPAPSGTPSRQQLERNRQAITAMQRASVVAAAGRMTAAFEYDNYDEAQQALVKVSQLIDRVASTAPDAVFQRLQAQRAAVVADLRARGADLTRLEEYTPRVTMPALVIAYDLYEDPDRDLDIVARNRAPQPNFMPGGRPLEVLSE